MTTFKFNSARSFKNSLGKTLAVVENAELAVRKMIAEAGQSGDAESYIKGISTTYDVKVDSLNPVLLSHLMCQLFIVTVHQQFEAFLRELRSEIMTIKWEKKKDGESLFNAMLRSFPLGFDDARCAIGFLEVEVADYYRLVRNQFAHGDADSTVRKNSDGLKNKVQRPKSPYCKLLAPNDHSALTFDDFILFNRCVQKIAKAFCTVARPEDKEIASMFLRSQPSEKGQKKVADLIKTLPHVRSVNSLRTLLRITYGLSVDEADPIIALLAKYGTVA